MTPTGTPKPSKEKAKRIMELIAGPRYKSKAGLAELSDIVSTNLADNLFRTRAQLISSYSWLTRIKDRDLQEYESNEKKNVYYSIFFSRASCLTFFLSLLSNGGLASPQKCMFACRWGERFLTLFRYAAPRVRRERTKWTLVMSEFDLFVSHLLSVH